MGSARKTNQLGGGLDSGGPEDQEPSDSGAEKGQMGRARQQTDCGKQRYRWVKVAAKTGQSR